METGSYKLDIEPEKKPIFVTQLHNREDEEENVVAYPVVKDKPSRLLETGVRTLQKTLVLKQEVEVDKVQAQLNAKREEFRRRMEACAQKQIDVQKKQQKMKDKVSRFEKFIQDCEAKRRRAIQKYQSEVKLREQKQSEFEALAQQMEDLRKRHRYLSDRIAKFKKYQDYLMKVLDAMPENYIETGDNPINSLMMRHRTLRESNIDLVDNVETMGDQFDALKLELDNMMQKHNSWKLATNSNLSKNQHSHDKKVEANKETELSRMLEKSMYRNQATELGRILIAIDNITEKCVKRSDGGSEPLELTDKLRKIQEYVREQEEVAKLTRRTASPTKAPSSS